MPPITAVSPLFTAIRVVTFLVSIEGYWLPAMLIICPIESLWISTVMMIRLSGVICGVTSSESTAFLNCTVGTVLLVPWMMYGMSVPCSICAFWLSAVTTLGLEMPLPSVSASSAESSRLMRLPLPRLMRDQKRQR